MYGMIDHPEKKMNRIIFLDVDGVLNNGSWAMEMYDKGIRVYRDGILYEPALKRLKRLVDATGAMIVVSSSWRQIPTAYGQLRDWLFKYGMTIADITPYIGTCRGDDITAWFNRNPGEWSYVILDDEDDLGEHMSYLVQTEFDVGLIDTDVERAMIILSMEPKWR